MTVRYTTLEAFTDEFVGALQVQLDRGLQAPLPRHRHPADRRRPVPRAQGEDRGGVLPHLQRAVRDRQPARRHLRPHAARHGRARRPPARALRVRPRRRHPPARPRHAPDDPAQARPARRRRSSPTPTRSSRIAERVTTNVRALAGRADPRRRLPLAHRPADRPRARRRTCSTASIPHSGGRRGHAHGRGDPARHVRAPRRLPARRSAPPTAARASPGPARSRCTSRAS